MSSMTTIKNKRDTANDILSDLPPLKKIRTADAANAEVKLTTITQQIISELSALFGYDIHKTICSYLPQVYKLHFLSSVKNAISFTDFVPDSSTKMCTSDSSVCTLDIFKGALTSLMHTLTIQDITTYSESGLTLEDIFLILGNHLLTLDLNSRDPAHKRTYDLNNVDDFEEVYAQVVGVVQILNCAGRHCTALKTLILPTAEEFYDPYFEDIILKHVHPLRNNSLQKLVVRINAGNYEVCSLFKHIKELELHCSQDISTEICTKIFGYFSKLTGLEIFNFNTYSALSALSDVNLDLTHLSIISSLNVAYEVPSMPCVERYLNLKSIYLNQRISEQIFHTLFRHHRNSYIPGQFVGVVMKQELGVTIDAGFPSRGRPVEVVKEPPCKIEELGVTIDASFSMLEMLTKEVIANKNLKKLHLCFRIDSDDQNLYDGYQTDYIECVANTIDTLLKHCRKLISFKLHLKPSDRIKNTTPLQKLVESYRNSPTIKLSLTESLNASPQPTQVINAPSNSSISAFDILNEQGILSTIVSYFEQSEIVKLKQRIQTPVFKYLVQQNQTFCQTSYQQLLKVLQSISSTNMVPNTLTSRQFVSPTFKTQLNSRTAINCQEIYFYKVDCRIPQEELFGHLKELRSLDFTVDLEMFSATEFAKYQQSRERYAQEYIASSIKRVESILEQVLVNSPQLHTILFPDPRRFHLPPTVYAKLAARIEEKGRPIAEIGNLSLYIDHKDFDSTILQMKKLLIKDITIFCDPIFNMERLKTILSCCPQLRSLTISGYQSRSTVVMTEEIRKEVIELVKQQKFLTKLTINDEDEPLQDALDVVWDNSDYKHDDIPNFDDYMWDD